MRRKKRMVACLCAVVLGLTIMEFPVSAAGLCFDPVYYAESYPDVVAVLGTNEEMLLNHYLTYGMKEMRYPYEGAEPGAVVERILGTSMDIVEGSAQFDPNYYANAYPDVVTVLGTDPEVLLSHYLTYGQKEGRYPNAVAATGVAVEITETSRFVPADKLANLSSLRKKMTDAELMEAYNVALEIVKPYADLSREDQLQGITSSLRSLFDSGMTYSMSETHYNDPYGYFVVGTASCAGCARATGMCLNILGIPYEHVNENQYSHQWCRVEVNGTYWICDAFGLYCGPEPAPYEHPYT